MLDTMHKTYTTRKDIARTAATLPVPVPAVQTGRHVMAVSPKLPALPQASMFTVIA
jgi:hypothetical protein